jgi:hypothetical protein
MELIVYSKAKDKVVMVVVGFAVESVLSLIMEKRKFSNFF